MDNDKDVIAAIAEKLKDDLDEQEQRLPAEIVEKLFAVDAAEKARN